jgi:hypothetical protein
MPAFSKLIRKRGKKSGLDRFTEKITQNHMEIAAILLIIAIAAIAFSMSLNLEGKDAGRPDSQEEVDTMAPQVSKCMELNPGMSEDKCRDLSYHDRAVSENDRSLCEKIKEEKIKGNCKAYFD